MQRSEEHFPILIVEDDIVIQRILKRVLEYEGYVVHCVSDGAEAIEWLRQRSCHPVLIILDLMMPGMDGWEFRRRQLMRPAWASIPVLAISADADVDEVSLKLRPERLLKKPFTIDSLLRSLNEAVPGSHQNQVPLQF